MKGEEMNQHIYDTIARLLRKVKPYIGQDEINCFILELIDEIEIVDLVPEKAKWEEA